MEKRDEELIERLIGQDKELKRLMDAHRQFERQLEDYNRRPYLTNQEAFEKKRIQKLKLAGRDRIESILASHRKNQT